MKLPKFCHSLVWAGFSCLLSGASVEAQVLLGAPGVGLTYREEPSLPFSHTNGLGRYYKFVFTGAEAQADADGVPGCFSYDGHMWNKAKKSNNGHGNNIDGVDSSNPSGNKEGLDSDPTVDDEKKKKRNGSGSSGESSGSSSVEKVIGWWKFIVRVNSFELSEMEFATSALHQLSDVIQVYFSTPIVLREQTIDLTWEGQGNSHDPDGHLYILGSAIKEPPVPFGQINLGQTLYTTGATPTYTWSVTRE